MARGAVAAKYKGDDYHHRLFFWVALQMLLPDSSVDKVEIEADLPKSLDDIAVYYNTRNDEFRRELKADHFQVKYHKEGGTFGYKDLIDPSFIYAQKKSFLQRLKEARPLLNDDGTGRRYILYSPWTIDPEDPLHRLYTNDAGCLDLESLRSKKSPSPLVHIRKAWMEHLGLTDPDELVCILTPLRFRYGTTLYSMSEQLNVLLAALGLQLINDSGISNPYDELAKKIIGSGETLLDAETLKDLLQRERLLVEELPKTSDSYKTIGIRSFVWKAEDMPQTCDDYLSVLDHFNARRIKNEEAWNEIGTAIDDFTRDSLSNGLENRFRLESHWSVAFAAGRSLGKSREELSVVQYSSKGQQIWQLSGYEGSEFEAVNSSVHSVASDQPNVAVAIGLTHSIVEDVKHHLAMFPNDIGKILSIEVAPAPSASSVCNAAHAQFLVQQVMSSINGELTPDERQQVIHIFYSGPNAVAFLLGRSSWLLENLQLHEHIPYPGGGSIYEPSIRFPLRSSTCRN